VFKLHKKEEEVKERGKKVSKRLVAQLCPMQRERDKKTEGTRNLLQHARLGEKKKKEKGEKNGPFQQ